jgi:hypothetical protein
MSLIGLLLILAAAPACRKAEEPKLPVPRKVAHSRPANAGCEWTLFKDERLGVQVPLQRCKEGTQLELKAAGNVIYLVAEQAADPTSGIKAIEVFEKPAAQPISDAIVERFVNKLPPAQRSGCIVNTPSGRIELNDSGKQSLEIIPAGGYAVEVVGRRKKEPNLPACGAYGDSGTVSYFEYHPNESQTKFFFVRISKETPVIDEQMFKLF